jgi:hypothetical protein
MSKLGRFGRFGNQVFQYAFLRLYAAEHGLRYEVPRWVGCDLFGHDDPPISDVYLPELYEPEGGSILSRIPSPVCNVDLLGFFLDTSYYAPRKDEFRRLFQPLPQWKAALDNAIKSMRRGDKTLVALHLRRGDFGTGKYFVPPVSCYRKWIADNWHDPIVYIASDNLDEVQREFTDFRPFSNRDINVTIPAFQDYVDYYVLTQADALAISNSSYSFSASMLNCVAGHLARPMFGNPRLVPFDPWNSPVQLTDQVPGEDYFDTISAALLDALVGGEVDSIRRTRRELANSWLTMVDEGLPVLFFGPLGRAQQAAIRAELFRTEPTSDDVDQYVTPALTSLRAGLESTWAIQYLLAVMLFVAPERLPFHHDLKLIPQWMLPMYIDYLRMAR